MKKVKLKLTGYPGWHIECSAMATKYLGEQFDLHCGGLDHIPVHHTNEIAQSEAALGKKPWVKYWLHNGFLELSSGEKMAKSGENFIILKTLEEKGFDPLDYRYFCLGTHYHKPLLFGYEALEGAKHARKHLIEKALELKKAKGKKDSAKQKSYLNKFMEVVNDDLNTPQGLALMWEMLKDETLSSQDRYALLLMFDEVFGLGLKKIKEEKVPAAVLKLAEERLIARKEKNWKKSDELRSKIKELGYVVGDTSEGYEIKKI